MTKYTDLWGSSYIFHQLRDDVDVLPVIVEVLDICTLSRPDVPLHKDSERSGSLHQGFILQTETLQTEIVFGSLPDYSHDLGHSLGEVITHSGASTDCFELFYPLRDKTILLKLT